MKLVENAREVWKHWSLQIQAATGALALWWLTLPQDWRDAVPREWIGYCVAAAAVLTIASKFVQQKPKE